MIAEVKYSEQLTIESIEGLLGSESDSLLNHKCRTIPQENLILPGGNYIDEVFSATDRPAAVLRNYQTLLNAGRLGGTGYMSILPVDQGIEHSAGATFAPNPMYFDPKNIVELAIEGGCNAVASTLGVLGAVSRTYAHKIPFILKLNHNDALISPTQYDQTLFGKVKHAYDMGAIGIGATIYFGSENSRRQLQEISEAFQQAHELGMVTILWCYLRNNEFKKDDKDYHVSSDLTGQANYLGVTIEADIIKQKMAENNGGFKACQVGRSHPKIYSDLTTDHPIDLVRYQVANCYMGRIGLINSGGASGDNDLAEVVRTAVINKRAGGMGLISGRKAFQRPFEEGVGILKAIQDVYLDSNITVA